MITIIPPIQPQDQGPAVDNLQQTLLFIVQERQLTPQGLSLAQWRRNLTRETGTKTFGPQTAALLADILLAEHLRASGVIDAPTANGLNQVLTALAAFAG